MIPKILHQTWATRHLPPLFARCREGWITRHRSWEHRFYDDAACRLLIGSISAEWLSIYERLPTAIQRADLFRYLVVYAHGGVYADMDMECYRPIDSLLRGAACVLSIEAHLSRRRQLELRYAHPIQLANCIFAAAPNHDFLQTVISEIARRVGAADMEVRKDDDVEDTTGPRMLTRCFDSLPERERAAIRVLPQVVLMAPRECPRIPLFGPPIHARHLCAGTWKLGRRTTTLSRWWIERNKLPPLWPRLDR